MPALAAQDHAATAGATAVRRRRRAPLAVAAMVLGLVWLLGEVRTTTGWDDTFYILQASSLAEDGDLDLRNDALYSRLPPDELATFLTATLPSGSLKNTFSIGPAMLWLPAYAAAMPWRPGAGTPRPARWSLSQLKALHLLSLAFFAAVGWFLYRMLEEGGLGGPLALGATLALLIGTPLAVYGPGSYTMAHLQSALAVCLWMAGVWWLERDPRPYRALVAGAALGLTFLVRWQDVVFAALLWVPLAPLLGEPRALRRIARLLAATAAGALAVGSVQLFAWHLELGSWVTLPQGGTYMHWTHPHLADLLLSGYNGLLPWSPVFALALAGLLLPWRSPLPARWRSAALAVLAIEIYINAVPRDWWGGYSFGARRMTSCVPLLALGLANLGAFARMGGTAGAARRRRALAAMLAALCLWGAFVANLYPRRVHDLSLVVRGTPSLGAQQAVEVTGVVTDARVARRQAVRPTVHLAHNYFAGDPAVRRSVGVGLTLLLMAAAAGGTCLLLAWLRPATALQAAVLATLLLVLWCHLRLGLGPRAVPAERAVWRRIAASWTASPRLAGAPVESLAAGGATLLQDWETRLGRPPMADSYRYMAMLAAWQSGEPQDRAAALGLLGALAAKGYPAPAELRQRAAAFAPDAEVLAVRLGAFLEPRPGSASLAVRLSPAADQEPAAFPVGAPAAPLAGSATLEVPPAAQAWRCDFDLDLPEDLNAEAQRTDLLALQDADRGELARLSLRGASTLLLVTPQGAAAAALVTEVGEPLAVEVRYAPGEARVSASVTRHGAPPLLLSAPLSPAGAAPARLLFGRDRRAAPSAPLWGGVFSDLWVSVNPPGRAAAVPLSPR
jgi:hypothetical protein